MATRESWMGPGGIRCGHIEPLVFTSWRITVTYPLTGQEWTYHYDDESKARGHFDQRVALLPTSQRPKYIRLFGVTNLMHVRMIEEVARG